jgi:ferredoxin
VFWVDVTKLDALQAYSCVECGRCTEHCPAYNTGKTLNPKEGPPVSKPAQCAVDLKICFSRSGNP